MRSGNLPVSKKLLGTFESCRNPALVQISQCVAEGFGCKHTQMWLCLPKSLPHTLSPFSFCLCWLLGMALMWEQGGCADLGCAGCPGIGISAEVLIPHVLCFLMCSRSRGLVASDPPVTSPALNSPDLFRGRTELCFPLRRSRVPWICCILGRFLSITPWVFLGSSWMALGDLRGPAAPPAL